MLMLLKIEKHRVDASLCGITRTGSKGVSHSVITKTPSEAGKVKERSAKSKPN
jgi:hypothetical protein